MLSSFDRGNQIRATIMIGAVSIAIYDLWMRYFDKRTKYHERFSIPPELQKGKYAHEMALAIKCAIHGKYHSKVGRIILILWNMHIFL